MSGFVDEAQLNVRGGDGGAGAVSIRREAHVPLGGPDGGDGGKGGDIWLVADRNVSSLLAFKDHPHRRATSGKHGQGKRKHGAGGDDLVVAVPEGTTVYDQDHQLLADLVRAGDRWLAAAGGRGGRGNARFLSNRRRAPSFAEQGEEGEERWLNLEIRLLADVALVGFPNVGKSTLISRISAAKPKIADYPFTTLEPNLGVVRLDEGDEIVVADLPGLIEGASEGRGLGHQFLRHVERARALAILIDLAPTAELEPADQERILLAELQGYRPELLDRPRVLVGSKADIADADRAAAWDGPTFSAVTGDGIPQLVGAMAGAVRSARAALPEPEPFVVHRPQPEGLTIERIDTGAYVVHGRAAERAVALSDITNQEALAYVQERLKRLGVDKALAKAGAQDGDPVHIGKFSFDYLSE
ncbi:MAG: Obg family GTPase CgtA [Acidimicrobiales bacterium]|nr:Obg family GTPase CgtA [Acidimicrobiales bacterium]